MDPISFGLVPILQLRTEGKRVNYIQTIELQKLARTGELLGGRHCHKLAVGLQVATSLSTPGVKPRNTTSCLCFYSSQQHRRMRLETATGGIPSGALVFHRPSTGATLFARQTIFSQKLQVKMHFEMMWSASSS